jgi:hypothetical protein
MMLHEMRQQTVSSKDTPISENPYFVQNSISNPITAKWTYGRISKLMVRRNLESKLQTTNDIVVGSEGCFGISTRRAKPTNINLIEDIGIFLEWYIPCPKEQAIGEIEILRRTFGSPRSRKQPMLVYR